MVIFYYDVLNLMSGNLVILAQKKCMGILVYFRLDNKQNKLSRLLIIVIYFIIVIFTSLYLKCN